MYTEVFGMLVLCVGIMTTEINNKMLNKTKQIVFNNYTTIRAGTSICLLDDIILNNLIA